jgi:nucleotide-binding universal stress UspA family protein
MIPKIRNILYATDLTENSVYAFRYAINSAQKYDAQIHILHAIERPLRDFLALMFPNLDHDQLVKLWNEKKSEQVNTIQGRLQEFAKRELEVRSETQKRVASIIVVEGEPAAVILQKAEDLNCDLIIMGTHGKGSISHAFLGSVAEKVLHRVRKPVFIIPLPEGQIDSSLGNI